ncbi:uncharacterized protein TNCV_3758701 [Trichonephila clavipes]|nr:uncharacterized protein TNCV_3758701 [Trichonephila clavipes]
MAGVFKLKPSAMEDPPCTAGVGIKSIAIDWWTAKTFWADRLHNINIVTYIKNMTSLTSSKYNELNGHFVKMDKDRTTEEVFNAQPIGTRRKGRPNLIWIDGLEKDLLVLKTKNWRTLAGRRLAWKRLLEKATAYPGLSSH